MKRINNVGIVCELNSGFKNYTADNVKEMVQEIDSILHGRNGVLVFIPGRHKLELKSAPIISEYLDPITGLSLDEPKYDVQFDDINGEISTYPYRLTFPILPHTAFLKKYCFRFDEEGILYFENPVFEYAREMENIIVIGSFPKDEIKPPKKLSGSLSDILGAFTLEPNPVPIKIK